MASNTNERQHTTLNEFGLHVADHVTAMLAYWDNKQVCRFANSAYQEWFGKTRDEMIGKITMEELLGPIYKKNLPYITGALNGVRQVFEREIPLPDGGSRHSIATYYPDITEKEVRGFFVHVADVTPVKLLEAKILELQKTKKKDMLRSVIETREKEKESIAYELRDSISQTLAYCKLMLQNANSKDPENTLLKEITEYIHQAIHELNTLSNNLSPSGIQHFGLKPGLEDYILNFQKQYNHQVLFICDEDTIEKLSNYDKISVFRIIQNFILLMSPLTAPRNIYISIRWETPRLYLQLSYNDSQFELPLLSQEFTDIQTRVEYYEGSIKQICNAEETILNIELPMTESKENYD